MTDINDIREGQMLGRRKIYSLAWMPCVQPVVEIKGNGMEFVHPTLVTEIEFRAQQTFGHASYKGLCHVRTMRWCSKYQIGTGRMTMKNAMKITTMLAAAAIMATAQAQAMSCSPSDNTSRVLASPDPNDIHPNWRGESYIGTSWSVDVERRIDSDTGSYLKGDLISPRGEVVTPGVYILEDEWDCE